MRRWPAPPLVCGLLLSFSLTSMRLDLLYLPALWYHRVSQDVTLDKEGGELALAIAVNWWADMAMDSPLQSLSTSLRRLTLQLDGVTEDAGSDEER